MSEYPKIIYARIVEPGTDDEFMLTGPELANVAAEGYNSYSAKVARYVLAGVGEINYVAPQYVEDVG